MLRHSSNTMRLLILVGIASTHAFAPTASSGLLRKFTAHQARMSTTMQLRTSSSVAPSVLLRGPVVNLRAARLTALNQFAGGASKWDDPDYDPTKQEIETEVPLHIAAWKGELDEVKKLLSDGADVNEATETGWTGLMWAQKLTKGNQARGGKPETLTALKEAGGDLLAKNKFGSTPLHAAAHWGSPECTELLLEWLDKDAIETTNAFGWTALHWAGKGGHGDAAKLLIDAGADVDARNMKGNTPLIESCANGGEGIIKALLAGGSSVTATSEEGETALHQAAYLGFDAACKLLLEAGAEADAVDKEGATPLYRAARGGEVEVVELLLEKGANPNIKSTETGWCPIHEASRWGRQEVVELLIKAGADVNAKTGEDEGPLHLAALWGRAWDDAEVAAMLIEAGADKEAKNARDETPLDIAKADVDEEDFEDLDLIQALVGAAD